MPKKLPSPRGNKRQRTRTKLIEAAAKVIAEKGYDRMSFEEVAASAGMTRGAIYGNFKNKDDLILAVVQARWRPLTVTSKPGSTFKEHMRLAGEAVAAASTDRASRVKQALAFQLYALNHETVRKRVASANAKAYEAVAEELTRLFPRRAMPMAPEKLIRVLHALGDGLMIGHAMYPDEFTKEVIVAAFEALA